MTFALFRGNDRSHSREVPPEPPASTITLAGFEPTGDIIFLSRDMSRCGCASQKPFRAQIFVQFRPMDSVSPGTDFPMHAGFRISREEPGKPGQRDGDRASVHQIHAQRILVCSDVFDAFIRFRCQNTHAMPPERIVD